VHDIDYERLVEGLPVIQTIFSSKEETIEYCRRFQEIGEFWTLYHVAQFCYFLEKMKESYDMVDEYTRRLIDINRLIMMASIVELLNSKEDFARFDEWIKQEEKDEELRSKGVGIWHEYNRFHGSAEKFRAFFKEHLSKDEKIKLMKSVQFYLGEEKKFFPLFCYKDAECNVGLSYCTFDTDKERCPAYTSTKRINRGVREFADFLYTMRSKFVHEARLFLLPTPLPKGTAGSSWLFDFFEYEFKSARKLSYKGMLRFGLLSGLFTELVQKYLKALMDKYIEAKSERSS